MTKIINSCVHLTLLILMLGCEPLYHDHEQHHKTQGESSVRFIVKHNSLGQDSFPFYMLKKELLQRQHLIPRPLTIIITLQFENAPITITHDGTPKRNLSSIRAHYQCKEKDRLIYENDMEAVQSFNVDHAEELANVIKKKDAQKNILSTLAHDIVLDIAWKTLKKP